MHFIDPSSLLFTAGGISTKPVTWASEYEEKGNANQIQIRLFYALQVVTSHVALPLIVLIGLSEITYRFITSDCTKMGDSLQSTMTLLSCHIVWLIPGYLIAICSSKGFAYDANLSLRTCANKVAEFWLYIFCRKNLPSPANSSHPILANSLDPSATAVTTKNDAPAAKPLAILPTSAPAVTDHSSQVPSSTNQVDSAPPARRESRSASIDKAHSRRVRSGSKLPPAISQASVQAVADSSLQVATPITNVDRPASEKRFIPRRARPIRKSSSAASFAPVHPAVATHPQSPASSRLAGSSSPEMGSLSSSFVRVDLPIDDELVIPSAMAPHPAESAPRIEQPSRHEGSSSFSAANSSAAPASAPRLATILTGIESCCTESEFNDSCYSDSEAIEGRASDCKCSNCRIPFKERDHNPSSAAPLGQSGRAEGQSHSSYQAQKQRQQRRRPPGGAALLSDSSKPSSPAKQKGSETSDEELGYRRMWPVGDTASK